MPQSPLSRLGFGLVPSAYGKLSLLIPSLLRIRFGTPSSLLRVPNPDLVSDFYQIPLEEGNNRNLQMIVSVAERALKSYGS